MYNTKTHTTDYGIFSYKIFFWVFWVVRRWRVRQDRVTAVKSTYVQKATCSSRPVTIDNFFPIHWRLRMI